MRVSLDCEYYPNDPFKKKNRVAKVVVLTEDSQILFKAEFDPDVYTIPRNRTSPEEIRRALKSLLADRMVIGYDLFNHLEALGLHDIDTGKCCDIQECFTIIDYSSGIPDRTLRELAFDYVGCSFIETPQARAMLSMEIYLRFEKESGPVLPMGSHVDVLRFINLATITDEDYVPHMLACDYFDNSEVTVTQGSKEFDAPTPPNSLCGEGSQLMGNFLTVADYLFHKGASGIQSLTTKAIALIATGVMLPSAATGPDDDDYLVYSDDDSVLSALTDQFEYL